MPVIAMTQEMGCLAKDAAQRHLALLRNVLDAGEREQAGSVAGAVPGVSGVTNESRLMTSPRRFASAKQT